jgi:hypothetical protein
VKAIQAYWIIRRSMIAEGCPLDWIPSLKDIRRWHKDEFIAGGWYPAWKYEHIIAQETCNPYWEKKCGCKTCRLSPMWTKV